MDLGAYAQINELAELAKKNGIDVPRLRGYRLMADETPLSKEEQKEFNHSIEMQAASDFTACFSKGHFYPTGVFRYNRERRRRRKKLIDEQAYSIRGGNIHGKARRALKFYIKQEKRKAAKQQSTFDSFCGRKDVLYIHARLGGANWCPYLEKEPWFICKINDAYDSTYCDIYAKLNIVTFA